MARDKSAHGRFYYSVELTGIYCRPSCPSRLANPKNVRFHATAAEAEAAGFRPCRRCEPNGASIAERQADKVAAVCRLIETTEEMPSLARLAEEVGLSAFHFHRVFKAVTGLTPKDYATAHRTRRVQGELTRSRTVTQAIYDAGFNSNSRFYEKSDQMLGMTPSRYRAGGMGARIRLPSASARSARSWWPAVTRAFAPSSWARIRTCFCATCRTASHGRS